jgi:uncharacterized alkaline shock family protein YloU
MFFYTLVFLGVGCGLIALSFNIITLEEITNAIEYTYALPNIRVVMGAIGSLLIIYSLMAVQIALGNLQREKTIAFENPSGRVTISLSAIEEFIRRTATHISEIKELRADVTASKKGINVTNKIVVYSDANIPDTTERVQNILKNKIQEMLGIEEPINIKVHITKIITKESKETKSSKIEKSEEKKVLFKGIEYGDA